MGVLRYSWPLQVESARCMVLFDRLTNARFGRTLSMAINADKPHLWKADTRASVDQFNRWFMKFAPKAYRDTRKKTIKSVEQGLKKTSDLTMITPWHNRGEPGHSADASHVHLPAPCARPVSWPC